MTARGRALAILTGLAVFVAGWVVFVSDWSGPAGAGPDGRGTGVAGTRAADLDAFRNELLVWAPGGFSEKEVGRVRDSTRVASISAVRTGTLAAASGRRGYRVVPVETMAVDTNAYTTATGRPGRKLATLLTKGAVLSKTGAKLRRVKSGGKLKLDGNRTLRVSGVVDDALLGGYEVALERTLARRYGIQRAAYLLVRPRGPVDALRTEIRKLLKGRSVRFVTPGDRPFVRGGDGVLPMSQVKARFGEFALPSLRRGWPDPAWTKANLVTKQVPLLGRPRAPAPGRACRRQRLPAPGRLLEPPAPAPPRGWQAVAPCLGDRDRPEGQRGRAPDPDHGRARLRLGRRLRPSRHHPLRVGRPGGLKRKGETG
jgi:hypothetical protein